ncbi:MAG: hypothetical protein U0324_43575 [Polyangiales bacterium]
MSELGLSYRGSWAFDEVREALGDGLTALGDTPEPWAEVSRRALEDLTGAGHAFEGVWRRGEATLSMRAAHQHGDPRDGHGYVNSITLDSPRLSFRWSGTSWEARIDALSLTAPLTPAAFRALRAALAKRLGGDVSDEGWTALANVEALADVDAALQREVLAAALAQTPSPGGPWPSLLKWKVAILGGTLAERLDACPADLDAWTEALASPPEGFPFARVAAVCARLAPWDPSRPAHRLAPAWRWLPALGGDGEAPPGWRQLDDGADPPWVRPSLAANVARALGASGASEANVGWRALDAATRGGATARAHWGGGALPRVHVTWVQRPAEGLAPIATVDWVWGDGDDDVLVLAARRLPEPASPAAMFLSGTEAFQAAAMEALHRWEPFAWRPAARPLARAFAAPRAPSSGARDEVAALLLRAEGAGGAAGAAFDACRCAQGGDGCEHQRAIAAVLREAERRRYGEPVGPRDQWALDALAHACRAAQARDARAAAEEVDWGWRALSVAAAVTAGP